MDIRSEDELIQALLAALAESAAPDGALTTRQIQEHLDAAGRYLSVERIRLLIRRLEGRGLVAQCRVPSARIDGTTGRCPAYRICQKR